MSSRNRAFAAPRRRDYFGIRSAKSPRTRRPGCARHREVEGTLAAADGQALAAGHNIRNESFLKLALARNAAALILCRPHPSGVCEPSRADELITTQLREAPALVDVRVVDHIIVAGGEVVSLAERGPL